MILIEQQNKSRIYSCVEHIDQAIDDFLVKYETFPILLETKEICCSYCSKNAIYVLEISD
ncbi:MAG: CxxH/CxxC protein [Solirubrobacterales bacterium]